MRLEHDNKRQVQAAAEAIEVLEEAGFIVGDSEVYTSTDDAEFALDLILAVDQNERPLENVGACERDDCPRAD